MNRQYDFGPDERAGFRLAAAGRFLWVQPPEQDVQMPVTRLSGRDLSFLPSAGSFPRLGTEQPLVLRTPSSAVGPFSWRITRLDSIPPLGRTEVTAELTEPQPEQARRLLSLLWTFGDQVVPVTSANSDLETVEDPARVRSLVRALFANRYRAVIREIGGTHRWRAARLAPDYRLLVEWEAGDRLPEPPFEIEVGGYYCDYRFLISDPPRRGVPPMPARVAKLRRRGDRRVPAPPQTTVSFAHPVWPELRMTRSVCDLSLGGLSVSTGAVEDLLYPGLLIDDMQIAWKRGQVLRVMAQVRHVSPAIHGEGQTCGLSIVHEDGRELPWAREVWDALHPRTRVGQPWQDDVWDLCVASGYLGLSDKEVGDFEALRPRFVAANRKLATAPGIGCQVTWPTQDRVEATISHLKVWRHAWLVHQLARYNEARPLWVSGDEILRDVYLRGYEHALLDRDARWHVGYVQDAAKWSRLVHYDFPLRYADSDRACIVPFRAWEGRCDSAPAAPFPLPPGTEVTWATAPDLCTLLEHVHTTRPRPYVEANDYLLQRFDLADVKRLWRRAGLERDRQVIVARNDGQLRAAAVLELAEDGLHLYGLLDIVRLFELEPGGADLFPALLERSRSWYRERGKTKFVYFDEHMSDEHARQAGFADLGGASLTVIGRELIPDLLEHVLEVTAPRSAARPATA